ncbi:MAG: metallophosphoesterase [Gammaproteobacteria bacterium]|nr:metallophosphoesterase [Gammaproteobacteria bacterium]
MNKKSRDKLFAIGDIHGCATELEMLLEKLPLDADSTVVFVGDFIDRGAQSKRVIEIVLDLKQSTNVVALMGNHEQMLLSFLDEPESALAGMFIYNGGGATLASYSDAPGEYSIPDKHINFLRSLQLYHQLQDYVFVHAGLPDIDIAKLDIKKFMMQMLWIRGPFLKSEFDWKSRVIHGHTPVTEVEFRANRINLDTGCAFNGNLSAVGLPSGEIYSVPKQEEMDLVFLRDVNTKRVATRFKGTIPVTIQYEDQPLDFVTVNYSEFGIYIRGSHNPGKHVFAVNDLVKGEIGLPPDNSAEFEGSIVRVDYMQKRIFYAIRMLRPIIVQV